MAAAVASPELVTWLIVKFWKGTAFGREKNEYTPHAAAARMASAMTAPTMTPHLWRRAAATTAELSDADTAADDGAVPMGVPPDGAGEGVSPATPGVAAGAAMVTAERPESVSRFRRSRSERRSSACW